MQKTVTILALLTAFALAGCGVDGAPERPKAKKPQTTTGQSGISITGTVGAGVSGGSAPASLSELDGQKVDLLG